MNGIKCGTKVVSSSKVGRFKISLLEQKRIFRQPESARDYRPEKIVISSVVALEHSRFVGGEWRNQTIYCPLSDVANLREALNCFLITLNQREVIKEEMIMEDTESSETFRDEISSAIRKFQNERW